MTLKAGEGKQNVTCTKDAKKATWSHRDSDAILVMSYSPMSEFQPGLGKVASQ